MLVEEQRAFAAQCLREEERRVDERRRVELRELEIGHRRARAVRRRDPVADGAGRIRRPAPKRGGSAGGEERRPRAKRAVVCHDACAAIARPPDRPHPLALDDADSRMSQHAAGERTGHVVAGRRASRVDDAAAAVPSFEPEVVVELDAELDEIPDACGRLARERRDGAPAREAPPGAACVLRVQRRPVVLPHGGRDTALGQRARRGEKRALGEDDDVRFRGRAERREEPGDSAADDQEVGRGVARACLGVCSW